MYAPAPVDVGSLLKSPDEADRLRGAELARSLDEDDLVHALESAATDCPVFSGATRVPAEVLDLAALVEVSWFTDAFLSLQLPEGGAELSALAEYPALAELGVVDPASHPRVRGLETLPLRSLRWLDLGTPRTRVPVPAGLKVASAGAWRPTAGRHFRR
jgi:hypothetical protein